MISKRAAISFTGGKDCTLSLCLTKTTHDVVLLVTFVPKNFKSFKAHSLEIIQLQAKALNIPHVLVEIGEDGKTHLQCYREQIEKLKQDYSLDLLVTGDILNVCDNFMARATKDIIELSCPIWAIDRHELMDKLFERQFELLITCASIKKLGDDESLARQFVGSRLTPDFIKNTLEPRQNEVDMGGELGEFHTMVLTVPELYNGYRIQYEGHQTVEGEYMFMEFSSFLSLIPFSTVSPVQMSQESYSRQESLRGTSTTSRASSLARTSSIRSRTPSPDSHLQRENSNQEVNISENDSSSEDATSLLGSVWNLVRDARELAAKELDKLLEHFPYRSSTRTEEIINRDQILSRKKERSLPSTLPPKSLLGHGPRVKQRGYSSKSRQHTLTRSLFDEDLKNHVNDVTPQNILRMSSNTTTEHRPGDNNQAVIRHSQDLSVSGSAARSKHQSLKRKASSVKHKPSFSSILSTTDRYAINKDSDGWGSTSDSQYNEEDTDHSEYLQSESSQLRLGREPSPTPSISSLAGNLSISGHASAHYRHKRHSSNSSLSTRLPRYSLLGEPLDHSNHAHISPSIYPESLSRRKESLKKSRPVSLPPPTMANQLNNPFWDSRESSPLPSSFANTMPEPNSTPSSSVQITQVAQVENEKLNELQQELAAIKKQLASLVSARNDDLERAHLSPTHATSPIPPPPPPFSNLVTSKKWTPPHSAASLSMQNVLKELSSSKVQLRKTGSPFVSRISSAVDSSPSSKYTSLAIGSKDEQEDSLNDTTTSGLHSPIANIQYLKKKAFTKSKSSASKFEPPANNNSLLSGTDVEVYWPSPKTLERADSRLDVAVKDLANIRKRDAATPILSSKTHNDDSIDEPKPQEAVPSLLISRASSAPEGKRKRSGTNDIDTNKVPSSSFSSNGMSSLLDIKSEDRPRSGPKLVSNKKAKPVRILHRSKTDPIQLSLHQLQNMATANTSDTAKRVSFQSSVEGKEHERQWFRESDMDSWRVSN
ncbi:hypothetical protein BGZ49_004501 [Haplosporangium sp. Z 27]|nr:hypothetical protein BGZ49_004501 [Haplosporangium sp. Z 27]